MTGKDSLPASRSRLASVLRAAKDVVSIDTTAKALDLDRTLAAKLLSRWRAQGWLRRIGRGLYVPVPLDLVASEQVVEDPWVLVPTLFDPCYIGGWTAAHHWDLTEQLFNETVVFTTRRVDAKRVRVQGVSFLLHHTVQKRLFGLKTIWRGARRVSISDPARTIIDMLAMPETGGGIDHVADCLTAHAKTAAFEGELLIRYAAQFGNGAIFKRLGFLAETRLNDVALAAACRARLTQGYTQLDHALPSSHLHTAWRLWVPERWRKAAP
jgi:predicted transcriptional regulator of viral defense system